MFGVDDRSDAAFFVRVGSDGEGQGGFTGGLRAVDLYNATAGHAADANGHVEGDGAGGYGTDLQRSLTSFYALAR